MQLVDARILVVEDEMDSMELIQGILDFHGVKSTGAGSAEEALEKLQEVIPNIIIIDLSLPEMDGWSLMKEITSLPECQDVKRVAVTAYHAPGLSAQAIEAGFDAYFSKPIDATSFVDELANVLDTP